MPLDFTPLNAAPRLLIEASLKPVQGHRFQPTGFPNLGAATYKAPDGTDMLLVESAQSVANGLESVCWDTVQDDWVDGLKNLPVIKVFDGKKKPLTNSVLQDHRINSSYILDGKEINGKEGTFVDVINSALKEITPNGPVDTRQLAKFIFRYCPNTLIHGVFFANKKHSARIGAGRLRLPRLISGFIEASDVKVAASGGAKIDRVEPGETDNGSAETGYGNVPFPRDEFTAKRITAYFNLDLVQIRSFGLGVEAENLLIALSLFKIRKFLFEKLRLRTACDLDLVEMTVTKPSDFCIPELAALKEKLPDLITAVARKKMFADPLVTIVTWTPTVQKAGKGKGKAADDEAGNP